MHTIKEISWNHKNGLKNKNINSTPDDNTDWHNTAKLWGYVKSVGPSKLHNNVHIHSAEEKQ